MALCDSVNKAFYGKKRSVTELLLIYCRIIITGFEKLIFPMNSLWHKLLNSLLFVYTGN